MTEIVAPNNGSAGATAGFKRAAKLIDNTVFDAFKTLTSETESERLDGSLSLLHHLNRSHDAEKHAKERDYTLIRLVRGLGASTLASRAGYFTTLVGFLSNPANADIEQPQIIAVLEKQLHIGAAVANKEDSDALVGHVMLVGALMRSKRLGHATPHEHVQQCVQILVRAAGNKVFHASLAYTFLVDLLQTASSDQFHAAIWPTMRRELIRPWERHTCNTLHFLLVAQAKYPELVDAAFLQKSLKTTEILTPQAHKHLGRIFWANTSLAAITHPAYEALSRFLLSVKRKQLTAFWTGEISETLAAPNKIKEVVTLKLLTDFLNETAEPLKPDTLLALLTPRFIKMIVGSLRALKVQRHDVLIGFYEEFFDALHTWFGSAAAAASDDADAGRVAIIRRFILNPGTLLIEKYLPQKTVHQLITKLGANGVRSLYDVYRTVFIGKQPGKVDKSTATTVGWQNVERVHAAQMMQYLLTQKCVQSDLEWRTAQLQFLLTVGLFHVNDDGTEVVVRRDQAGTQPNISKELSTTARNLFYASLQMRLPQLRDEKQVLLAVAEHANTLVQRKNVAKLLRNGTEWTAETQAAWQQAYDVLQAGSSSEKKLTLVFQILFVHMALQLFREPEMARVAIADLVQCMAKTKQVKKAHKKAARKSLNAGETNETTEQEPEWIEVVVDLFLHLLSQNTSFLRNVVSNVFPQLCGELTLTAVHQVLAMLDMKDGKNPLSAEKDDDAEEGEEEDAEEQDDEVDEDEEMESGESADEDNDDDDEEDDDDDDEVMEEDEGTVTDQLRNAVSTALGALHPTAGKANNTNENDDDADSVDLNDIDDAEAARLDAALSAAFQSIRKAGAPGTTSTKSKKKTKAERTTNTTVMHFRIRVLDLIDIYLRTAPALSVTVEILLALFNMIEYCTASDLRPLADTVDRVLKRLLALRQFTNVNDVTASNLCDLMQSLVAKKVNPIRLSAHAQLLSRSFAFLIASAQQLPAAEGGDAQIRALIADYAAEFVRSRNPSVPFNLLQDLFRVRWQGVWLVGRAIAEQALGAATVRTFRRTQVLQLLALLYRNHGFIVAEADAFNAINAHIETALGAYVKRYAAVGEAEQRRVSHKELEALLELLNEIHRCHQLKPIRAGLKWKTIGEQVQTVRARVALVALKPYKRFCLLAGLPVLRNTVEKGQTTATATNGVHDADSDNDDDDAPELVNGKATNGKAAKKRKAPQDDDDQQTDETTKDAKREKKLKKAERLRIASEGLNDLSFRKVNGSAANDDAEEEEDSD